MRTGSINEDILENNEVISYKGINYVEDNFFVEEINEKVN